MVGEHAEPDDAGVPGLEQVAHEHQVAQGLGHLLAVHADHGLVHPVPDEGLTGGGLGLRGLALVVGVDQVRATAVQVDGRAQLAHRQGRALDVPARSTRSPERVPGRLVLGRGLPEHEVEGVALVGVVGVAAPLGGEGQHLLGGEVADLAEALERGDVEVDGAAGLVGVAPVQDHADEAPDVGDGRGGPGLAPVGQQPEGAHVGLEARGLGGRQVEVVHAELAGLAQDVVVDVGDVAHAPGLVAAVAETTLEDVVGEVGGGVTEVAGVVGRDAARVHEHDRAGLEGHDLALRRAVQLHRRPVPHSDHSPRSIPVNFTAARVL